MIVFAMAGQSRRFFDAGYDRLKFMLDVGSWTVFDYAVAGFLDSFKYSPFVFVFQGAPGVRDFIESRLALLGVEHPSLVQLDGPTAGQAQTVELGLMALDSDARALTGGLTVFNVDTFRKSFSAPHMDPLAKGYLEVFRGSGSNWSFVEPSGGELNSVARTTEKEPISDLCCTGLYQFSRIEDFHWALAKERAHPSNSLAETYVAPIYNHLIRRGDDIRYHLVNRDEVIFCGVPDEYEAVKSDLGLLDQLTARLSYTRL